MNIVGTRTLGGALADKAARFPDRPFLCFEDADDAVSPWQSWCAFGPRPRSGFTNSIRKA